MLVMVHFRVVADLQERKLQELTVLVNSSIERTTISNCTLVSLEGGRFSTNRKGYVQIAVKTPKDEHDQTSNTKVQLHQLVVWMAPEPFRQAFRYSIGTTTGEVSHRCHEKRCSNYQHLCIESSQANKSRNGCQVIIAINGEILQCCKHIPSCIATEYAHAKVICYTVLTDSSCCNQVVFSNNEICTDEEVM
jgi:Zinc-binding loop region of homing endonuclease